ncbi:MAG: HDOD domain-containing protein [Opitutales bacterium]
MSTPDDIAAQGIAMGRNGAPISDFVVIDRINQCPKLASLRSINQTLSSLLNSEDSFVAQIAEVIRLDPSLTTRVLDLVNSIFFGSPEEQHVKGVEEAALLLGLNRISELIIATPIIEDIVEFGKSAEHLKWVDFWKHSIGSAILTRELLVAADFRWKDESDYVAGLLHNLGKIIMAVTFPDEFGRICNGSYADTAEACTAERNMLGWDHAKMGAFYLWNHHIAREIVETSQWHNDPASAPNHPELAAAAQLGDVLVRAAGIPGIEHSQPLPREVWTEVPGWEVLFGERTEEGTERLLTEVEETLERVSNTLKGII